MSDVGILLVRHHDRYTYVDVGTIHPQAFHQDSEVGAQSKGSCWDESPPSKGRFANLSLMVELIAPLSTSPSRTMKLDGIESGSTGNDLDNCFPTDMFLCFALVQPDAVDVFVSHLETNERILWVFASGGRTAGRATQLSVRPEVGHGGD